MTAQAHHHVGGVPVAVTSQTQRHLDTVSGAAQGHHHLGGMSGVVVDVPTVHHVGGRSGAAFVQVRRHVDEVSGDLVAAQAAHHLDEGSRAVVWPSHHHLGVMSDSAVVQERLLVEDVAGNAAIQAPRHLDGGLMGVDSPCSGAMDVDGSVSVGPIGNSDKSTMAGVIHDRMTKCLGTSVPVQAVQDLIDQAFHSIDDDFGVEEAVTYGGDFEFPPEAVANGTRLFNEANGSLETVAFTQQQSLLPGRLNHERVEQFLSSDNPEKAKLHDLVGGIRVPTPTGFVPNGNLPRPPLRNLYQQVHHAVHMMLWGLIEGGLALLVPMPLALSIVGIHFIVAHWSAKKGKASGRTITDASDGTLPNSMLNDPSVKAIIDLIYGIITHPTIESIILMYLTFMDEHPGTSWDEIDIWKCDIRAAFTLLFWRPEAVKLFAMELVGGVAIIFLAGTFGWTGTPAAFQVVTRALIFELARCLLGKALMYVDDVMGISLRKDLDTDINATRSLITNLLGPTSFAEDKVETTSPSVRRLDNIGYAVDISKLLVTISRRNALKTTYGFLIVDETRKVPVRVMQKLASWASRYGKVCPLIKPFAGTLYGSYKGILNHNASIQLDAEVCMVIWFLRALLCALMLDESRFARPFHTFRVRKSKYASRFDASLKGIGILIGLLNEDHPELPPVWIWGGAVSLVELEFGSDSSYQNLAEFIGVVLVTLILDKLKLSGEAVELQGDSFTALTWAGEQRYRGRLVTRAAVLYTMIRTETGGHFNGTRHIPEYDNTDCDRLSRGESMRDIGLAGVEDLHLEDDAIIREIILLCKPTSPTFENDVFIVEKGFIAFWQRVRSVLGGAFPNT